MLGTVLFFILHGGHILILMQRVTNSRDWGSHVGWLKTNHSSWYQALNKPRTRACTDIFHMEIMLSALCSNLIMCNYE